MARKMIRLTLFGMGLLTIIAGSNSRSFAQGALASTIELSAQQTDKDKNKKVAPKQIQQHTPPQTIQRKQSVQKKINVQPKLNVQQKQLQQKKQINVQQKKPNLQQNEKLNVQQKNLNIQQQKFVGQPRKFVPKQNAQVYKFKMKGANQASLNGQNYSVWHNNYRIRHNGRWRTFVALGLLAPLLIGANEYYPYAYIDMPGPYCEGLTEDGCQLVYDEIETLDGDTIPQCLAYCPWQ